ncbi:DUF1080 domain-containing protein [bacterium]|nr:DUF1080 domain-containing protein [bacterium]
MKQLIIAMTAVLLCVSAGWTQDIMVQGDWEGQFFTDAWKSKSLSAQIVGESNDSYRIELQIDGQEFITYAHDQKKVTTASEVVNLGKKLGGEYIFSGFIHKRKFVGSFKNQVSEISFEMDRVMHKSPTLGLKPPVGATVLLGDKDMPQGERQELFLEKWHVPYHWVADKDGSIHRSGGSIHTKEEFGSAQIHVEFKCPYMPNDRGQGRGNSGVYVMGRYEVQVLDSFADEPKDNLCGGIYKFGVPEQYASYPPGTWQTYDITIHAPEFDRNGKKVKHAMITVKHNGKLIHDNLELSKPTPGGISGKDAPKGPLWLQDHSDPVRYKNVWIKPLD